MVGVGWKLKTIKLVMGGLGSTASALNTLCWARRLLPVLAACHSRPPTPHSSLPLCPAASAVPQKVWAEVWRQTQMALLMLALFMLAAWVVRGRAPWTP